jgi:predicted HD superfamily hydrolase involved in NAD metabolism
MIESYNIEELRLEVKKLVSINRYNHIIGVSHIAVCLGMINGCNVVNTEIAALLHDCAKDLNNEEYISRFQIELSEFEIKNPSLVHSKVGEAYAREIFNINNKDILNSIKYHTTGRPKMSKLEKIIYISDHIEPTRGNSITLSKIRKEAFRNIDKALILCLEDRLHYFKENNIDIDTITNETYDYYIDRFIY